MKISEVIAHQPLEMSLVENNHVIEQIATAATDEALCDSVLPRALERCADRLDTDGPHGIDNFGADDGNPVLRSLVKEGLSDWKLRLKKVVEQGIKNGEIFPKTEPQRIANTIIAALEGALMISRLEGTKTALRDVQATLDSLLEGLRTQEI